jgi:hypothetical protein
VTVEATSALALLVPPAPEQDTASGPAGHIHPRLVPRNTELHTLVPAVAVETHHTPVIGVAWMDYIPVPVLAVGVAAAAAVAVTHTQDTHWGQAQGTQRGASGIGHSALVSAAAAVDRTHPIHRAGGLHRGQGLLLERGCRDVYCALESQGGIEVGAGLVAGKVQIVRILGAWH